MFLTRVDQKNIKKNFSEIQNYDHVKNLEIKNHDLLTDWSKIGQFKDLEYLSVENSLINSDKFYRSLALLKKIKTLSIDEKCYFLKNDNVKKSQLQFPTLKKFIFICSKEDQINFDLEVATDNHREGKLNFLSFPNFPSCLPALEEIEVKNYESYLTKKELDYDDDGNVEENIIIYKLNFHNFSRIKNLKNIILCKSNEELFKNEKIISKIFQFPNDKKIKVNNNLIGDIKIKLASTKELYFEFDPTKINYDDQFDNTISKYELKPDSIIVHYPSHHYFGYTDRFQKIFDSAEVIVITSLQEFDAYVELTDIFIDDFLDNFTKGKSLKKIQIIIKNAKTDTHTILRRLIEKIKVSKKIEYEIIFEHYSNEKELSTDYENYLNFLYFILYADENKKDFKFTTNLDNNYLKLFLENVFFNQTKTIMVIEDKSNSKMFKSFNDIEVPCVEWPFTGENFTTHKYDLNYENILDDDLSFRDFFYETLHHGHNYLPKNYFLDNPNGTAIFVKKDFLDKSKKIVFNTVENISFQKITKFIDDYDDYAKDYDDYKDLKEKKFKFPLSFNKNKIKRLYIQDNFVFRISDLEEFKNLEEFTFSGHLDEDDKNMSNFPKMDKLRILDYSVQYPFIKQKDSIFKNFENSKNLEKITLTVGETTRRDEMRWTSYTVDVSKFSNFKKLNFLELNDFEQDNIKNLNHLKYLKTFNLINPFMITKDHNSDKGTVNEPLTEDDFKFLAQSKDLENLKIFFPRFGKERININFEEFIKYLNPKLKSIELLLALDYKQLSQAHILYNSVTKNLKEAEKIRLTVWDVGYPEVKYNKKKKDGYEIARLDVEKKALDPIIIDLQIFNDFKNLKSLELKFSIYIGTKIINLTSIKSFKKLDLQVEEHLLDAKELEKLFYLIASKKDIYMYEHNKNRKKIINKWNLDNKSKKDYEKIEEENDQETKEITINNKTIYTFLLNKKKIN
jgi:hypothetical protein